MKGKSSHVLCAMCYLQSCAICLTERTFIDEIEYDLESALEIYLQFFID